MKLTILFLLIASETLVNGSRPRTCLYLKTYVCVKTENCQFNLNTCLLEYLDRQTGKTHNHTMGLCSKDNKICLPPVIEPWTHAGWEIKTP